MEESIFWYTSQKDFGTAIVSLTKIAQFNGIIFEDAFREARDFLHGKRSKGIQCDFQPLLRLGLSFLYCFLFFQNNKTLQFLFRGY